MSFQSDFLSDEDQKYLYQEVNDVNLSFNILDEPPLLPNEEPTVMIEDMKNYNHAAKIPKPLTTVLSNEEYVGPFDFEVDIIPNGSKNAWVYSPALHKVYMDIKSPFPIDFKVKLRPNFPLFIRVTPMYSSPQFAQDCVYRCVNHEFSDETTNRGLMRHIRPHVIRCHNSSAEYIGDKGNNERLSVIIPLSMPQTGTDSIREMFEFMCKNSCPSPGMNRRAIEVIFTLEDTNSEIYGRKALNVRICSCPKRDKEKDEQDNVAKLQPHKGKKRRLEKPAKKAPAVGLDVTEYNITIPVVGKRNVENVMKYCHDLMAGEIVRLPGNSAEATAPYYQVLTKISDMIKEFSE